MARGPLYYCGHINVLAMISDALTDYVLKHNEPPAVIRTRAATFKGDVPSDIRGVRVVCDESIQPEHFMLCADGAE